MGVVEEEEEASKNEKKEEEVINKDEEVVTAVALGDGVVDAVHGKNVNEVRVIGDDDTGMAAIDSSELKGSMILVEANALYLTFLIGALREI